MPSSTLCSKNNAHSMQTSLLSVRIATTKTQTTCFAVASSSSRLTPCRPMSSFRCFYQSRRALCSALHNSKPVVDPAILVQSDISRLVGSINTALASENPYVQQVAAYYFDSGGKLIRPSVVLLMSRLCSHLTAAGNSESSSVSASQYKIALVAEMIHTASLVHDDVIDESDQRRNKPSVNSLWGNKKSILAGDYILAKATRVLASIGNPEVIDLLAQVIEDLVKGEFMQLHSGDEGFHERFGNYMTKTFMKTASLFANSCKAVALLCNCSEAVQNLCYEYGKNVGLAFQLIDDTLDFIGNTTTLGKPAIADLKLGISTAPVLFALEEYPEMDELVRRRFKHSGDVERAWDLVLKSNGIHLTKQLATDHVTFAIKALDGVPQSVYREGLVEVAKGVISRVR